MASKRASDGKVASTLGFLLHLLIVAIPKDVWRWLRIRRKYVKDQVVVITGGGSGLGQRMAEIFALDLDAKVAILDIDQTKARSVALDIESKGGTAKAWHCNVADAKSMQLAALEVNNAFGQVDIVICNAAILHFGQALQLSTEELQQGVNVNLMGTINTIRAFLGQIEARNSGQIVAVSSIAGFFGETYGLAYCPTKFAVRGVMESLRMELLDRHLTGIHCTTLCPYFVRTPMILSKGMRPTSRWIPFMSVDRCARQAIDAILKEKVLAFVPTWIALLPIIQILSSLNMQRAARDYLNCRYEPMEPVVVAKCPMQEGGKTEDCKTGLLGASLSPQKISHQDITTSFLTEQQNSAAVAGAGVDTNHYHQYLLPAMPNYFKFPSIVWFAIIPPALLATFLVWQQPEIFQISWLSYLGHFCYKLGTQYSSLVLAINIAAWLIHLAEGIYAMYVCDELNFSHACAFKWFLQTFVVGFPSLQLLLKYRKKRFSK